MKVTTKNTEHFFLERFAKRTFNFEKINFDIKLGRFKKNFSFMRKHSKFWYFVSPHASIPSKDMFFKGK